MRKIESVTTGSLPWPTANPFPNQSKNQNSGEWSGNSPSWGYSRASNAGWYLTEAWTDGPRCRLIIRF